MYPLIFASLEIGTNTIWFVLFPPFDFEDCCEEICWQRHFSTKLKWGDAVSKTFQQDWISSDNQRAGILNNNKLLKVADNLGSTKSRSRGRRCRTRPDWYWDNGRGDTSAIFCIRHLKMNFLDSVKIESFKLCSMVFGWIIWVPLKEYEDNFSWKLVRLPEI